MTLLIKHTLDRIPGGTMLYQIRMALLACIKNKLAFEAEAS